MLTKSALYVVATPIGNLNDISLRALDILQQVDMIAAEHIQTSKQLLSHHAIHTQWITLHQHNETAMAEKILALLATGKNIALLSDAGTPAISDPGAILVHQVRRHNYQVIPIPGANAAICAMSASGLTAPHFLFYGFLPTKSGLRQRALNTLQAQTHATIFYEAPHRILACITDMITIFGAQRRITICRELTKLFETIHTCSLGEALDWLTADTNQQKGEFVLLLSGAENPEKSAINEQVQHTLTCLLAELPLKQAVKLTVKLTGANKNTLYQLALDMQESKNK